MTRALAGKYTAAQLRSFNDMQIVILFACNQQGFYCVDRILPDALALMAQGLVTVRYDDRKKTNFAERIASTEPDWREQDNKPVHVESLKALRALLRRRLQGAEGITSA
jgi:hypothetical protein